MQTNPVETSPSRMEDGSEEAREAHEQGLRAALGTALVILFVTLAAAVRDSVVVSRED